MIPIFEEGKEAYTAYNKAVINTLAVKGPMSAWQLAKHIESQIKTVKDTTTSTRLQKVYSSLVRKDGRLNDLQNKGYIEFDLQKQQWQLTPKGVLAFLMLNHGKANGLYPFWLEEKSDVEKLKQQTNGSFIWDKCARAFMSPATLQKLAQAAAKAVERFGVNLDRVTDEALLMLMSHEKEFKEAMANVVSEKDMRQFLSFLTQKFDEK